MLLYVEFLQKFFELGISPYDLDLKLLFQILEEDDEKYFKVIKKPNDDLDLNGEEFFGQSEEEFSHDYTCMTTDISECKNQEEDSLRVE